MNTDWARRAPSRVIRRVVGVTGMRLIRARYAPTTVIGAEHTKGLSGPVVVVANHSSHADTMVLLTSLPRRIRRRVVVAAAADHFFSTPTSAAATALLIGAIPVDRAKVSRATLEECHRLLGEGWSLIIYPEGGRSDDGTINPFKPGAAWIARRAGVGVLPIHLDGTYDVLPKQRRRPRRHPVTIRIGEVLTVRDDEDARAFSQRIEAAVRELAGPESAGPESAGQSTDPTEGGEAAAG